MVDAKIQKSMRKGIAKASVVLAILFAVGPLVSCDSKTPEKKPEVIADSAINAQSDVIEEEIIYRKPVAFITGIDVEDQKFYKNARNYFLGKEFEVVDYAFSMQEIFNWLNTNYDGSTYGEIHIVARHNPWEGMGFETLIKGDNVTSESLRKAITLGELPTLKQGIKRQTKVVFHSEALGENEKLMKTLKDAFVADEVPSVIASPYVDVFGGEFSEHYLAKPYYVFYPYANSPGKLDLSKEIARKYPEEKEIDWFETLHNSQERYVGDAYYKRFSIPVTFEFDYTNSDDEMPKFNIPEAIMAWIEQDEELSKAMRKYNIPIEKFRWRSTVKGNTLIIKGKVTVLCVLKPLIKPYGDLQHVEPDTENLRLYAMM